MKAPILLSEQNLKRLPPPVFSVCGTVLKGNGLGLSLGFPTANIALTASASPPPHGVYASSVTFSGNTHYAAVTNVGFHPTVGTSEQILAESHILGFSGDLYGQAIALRLYCFLRPEKAFSTVNLLKEAILSDIRRAYEYFGI